ncbi:MAG TPA: Gfo/Idh/MocA family oxidoreductase [Micromonosporaceae bacterium]
MALRFGVFGTGHWATETHAAALATHPDVELVGIWGRDPAKAANLAGRYGVPAFDDVNALIDAVDAVAIALPPEVQATIAARAADAGRHLLLDKPIALTVADADVLAKAVERRGVASVVFFTNRFRPDVSGALAAAAATGDWYGARVTMFASIFRPGGPYGRSAWRKEWGGLWDIGPHALSLLIPVLGPVTEVSAVSGPHATTHLILRHTSDAVSTCSLTIDAAPEATAYDVVFYGENGVEPLPRGQGTAIEAYRRAVDQLVEEIQSGARDQQCDVRFGREVVAVLAAAELAKEEGRVTAPA